MQAIELREWRKTHDWTLEQAARMLGTTKTSIHRWEAGIYKIPQSVAITTLLLEDQRNVRRVEAFLYNTP